MIWERREEGKVIKSAWGYWLCQTRAAQAGEEKGTVEMQVRRDHTDRMGIVENSARSAASNPKRGKTSERSQNSVQRDLAGGNTDVLEKQGVLADIPRGHSRFQRRSNGSAYHLETGYESV